MSGDSPLSEGQPPGSSRGFIVLISILVGVLLAGSWVLTSSLRSFQRSKQPDLPVLGHPSMGFEAAERLGGTRQLEALNGKVRVVAYAYTRCARGCAGVAGQMLKLRDRFAGEPRVHFLSIAAWPQVDSPAMLAAYAESIGVKTTDPWWWLSGDRAKTWEWMNRELGFEPSKEIPEAERLNPEDVVSHDLRALLIDSEGRLRGYYQLMHPQTEVAQMHLEKLERDIVTVLAE